MKTHIVIVLDRSGSMDAIANDAVGSFNSFIDSLSKIPGQKLINLIQFNNFVEHTIADCSPKKIPKLQYGVNYIPTGGTALYDAIGIAINQLGKKQKVVFCVITDGEENSSQDFSYSQIQKMISKKSELGWKFEFLSSDIKSVETGKNLGFNSQLYANSSSGYASVSTTLFRSVQDYTSGVN